MKTLPQPCPSCPWRVDRDSTHIPNFSLKKAENLRYTCPSKAGGPEFGAPIFSCHTSKVGAEFACAGWPAAVGSAHPNVRLAVITEQLDPQAHLGPRPEWWPELHTSFNQVIRKLRRSHKAQMAHFKEVDDLKIKQDSQT